MEKALTVFVFMSVCLFTISQAKCRGKSRCIGLRDCAPYMSFVSSSEKPLKASVVNFLRAQECGFSEGYPKVCCGVIPKGIKALRELKPAPAATGLSINKLSNFKATAETIAPPINSNGGKMIKFENNKRMTPSFDITVSTASPDATAIPYLDFKEKQKKMDDLNKAFSELSADLMDFDLFRRRVRSSVNFGLDVEIR